MKGFLSFYFDFDQKLIKIYKEHIENKNIYLEKIKTRR